MQEDERNHLGRDLNNSVGGIMGTLHIKLQGILSKIQDPELKVLQGLLSEEIKKPRILSHDLTPPYLDKNGLCKH